MRKEEPGLPEDSALFEFVELGIAPGATADQGGVIIHNIGDVYRHRTSYPE